MITVCVCLLLVILIVVVLRRRRRRRRRENFLANPYGDVERNDDNAAALQLSPVEPAKSDKKPTKEKKYTFLRPEDEKSEEEDEEPTIKCKLLIFSIFFVLILFCNYFF